MIEDLGPVLGLRRVGRPEVASQALQQLGGAPGVAIVGAIFFDRAGSQGFTAAFTHAAPFVAAGFASCGLLALALPRTAVLDPYG